MSDWQVYVLLAAVVITALIMVRVSEKLDRVIRLLEIGNDISNERRSSD